MFEKKLMETNATDPPSVYSQYAWEGRTEDD